MPPVERKGGEIRVLGDVPDPMDWQQADSLGMALVAAARNARRAQWRDENRCVDCGATLQPGHEGDTCGPACPSPDVYHPLQPAAGRQL